jgi:thiopurine S-methyltransferase
LAALLPPQARMLLITLEYQQTQMSGPPFSVPRDEVRALFALTYRLDELECRDVLDGHPHFKQRGLTALQECAFLLRRK